MFTEYELNEFLIDFVYNSEAIEGLSMSRADVESIIMDGYSTIQSVNYLGEQLRTHYYLALEVLKIDGLLHIGTIKSWHERLFKNVMSTHDAGNFRTCEVGIGGSDVVLAKSEFVYRLMCTFFDDYNKQYSMSVAREDEYECYNKIGINHYKFERIHPFIDGNGRIGRLIMLHDMNRHGLDFKMITNSDVQEYYDALSLDEDVFGIWLVQRKSYK